MQGDTNIYTCVCTIAITRIDGIHKLKVDVHKKGLSIQYKYAHESLCTYMYKSMYNCYVYEHVRTCTCALRGHENYLTVTRGFADSLKSS